MNGYGFIRDELDIQILILYVLEKLPGVVEPYTLSDLCLFDGGFTWFDYSQCLAKLIRTGHIEEKDGGYEITDKGRRNVNTVATSLPYTVRAKADKLTAPVGAVRPSRSVCRTVWARSSVCVWPSRMRSRRRVS